MSIAALRLARTKLLSNPAWIAYLAAALVLCIGGWQITRAREAALLGAEHDARNLARSLAQHATRSVETVDLTLKGAVDQLEAGAFRDPGRFQGFLIKRAQSISQVISIAVLDESGGRLLVRHPAEDGLLDLDLSRTPLFQHRLPHAASDVFRSTSPIDGRERLTAYERLDAYPLVLAVALSVAETIAPWRREALIEGAVLALATVALVVLGLALARHHRRVRVAEGARRSSEAELRRKSALLEATLVSMDQGLIVVSSTDAVELCNPRALALLDLPPALMSSRPTTRAVLDYQLASGEFEAAPGVTHAHMQGRGFELVPHVYERRRPNGTAATQVADARRRRGARVRPLARTSSDEANCDDAGRGARQRERPAPMVLGAAGRRGPACPRVGLRLRRGRGRPHGRRVPGRGARPSSSLDRGARVRPGTPLSRPEPEIGRPIPLERLGEFYRADTDDLPHLLAALTPSTRARLAAYCYGKSHTHKLGLTIARACERDDLVRVAGEIGAVIHGQAHLKPSEPAVTAAGRPAPKPEAAPKRKISLGGSAAKGRSFD